AGPRVFERDLNGFVRRVAAEKAERHARFAYTVYLLEPNLKNGEGGYRDLLIGYWAAKARFRARDFGDLTNVGQASPRQVQSLVEARRFYLQVRTAMHLQARRKADRLTFEVQEAIAPALCPEPMRAPREVFELGGGKVEPAVAPQVEALMQRYFLHAKAVKRETERLIERCLVEPQRKPLVRAIDQSFAL